MAIELYIIGFCFLLSVLLVANYVNFFPEKSQFRKTQSTNFLRDNMLKKRLEKYSQDKVKFTTRNKVELLMKQAGFKLTYAEYLFARILSAGLFATVFYVLLGNPFVMFLCGALGFVLPKEVFKFMKNRRVERLESQIGPFLYMVNKRYIMNKNFSEALRLTKEELKGMEPMYTELNITYIEISQLGIETEEAMDNLALRTSNRFLKRYADYYRIVAGHGTDEMRKVQLNEAYLQYEEDRELKILANRELAGPKNNALISLGMLPVLIIYQINVSDDFLDFMLNTTIGQIGTAFILSVMVGCLWFINAKINAPLD